METKPSPQNLPQDIRTALQEHDVVLRLSYIAIVTGVNLLLKQGIPKQVISQVVTQAIEAVSKDFNSPTHQDFYSGMGTPRDSFATEEAGLRESSAATSTPAETAGPVEEPEKNPVGPAPECAERSFSGSTASPAGSAAQLIAEMKRNLPADSSNPSFHRMLPRGGSEPSSGARGSQMPAPGNRAVSLDTMNRIPRDVRRASIRGLLPTLEAWRTRCETVFLRIMSPAAWSRVSAAVVRRIRQPIYPAQVLQRWIFEFKSDWVAMTNALALPEIKKFSLRWLRRPIHSNPWRQARPGPLEARRDLRQ